MGKLRHREVGLPKPQNQDSDSYKEQPKGELWPKFYLTNKTQAGENETFVLFGLWLLGCETEAAGKSSPRGAAGLRARCHREAKKRERRTNTCCVKLRLALLTVLVMESSHEMMARLFHTVGVE